MDTPKADRKAPRWNSSEADACLAILARGIVYRLLPRDGFLSDAAVDLFLKGTDGRGDRRRFLHDLLWSYVGYLAAANSKPGMNGLFTVTRNMSLLVAVYKFATEKNEAGYNRILSSHALKVDNGGGDVDLVRGGGDGDQQREYCRVSADWWRHAISEFEATVSRRKRDRFVRGADTRVDLLEFIRHVTINETCVVNPLFVTDFLPLGPPPPQTLRIRVQYKVLFGADEGAGEGGSDLTLSTERIAN